MLRIYKKKSNKNVSTRDLVFKKIFGPQNEEVSRKWRVLKSEDIRNLNRSLKYCKAVKLEIKTAYSSREGDMISRCYYGNLCDS